MNKNTKIIFSVLVAISVVGLIGIPMGDPQFLINAIFLELSFISLAIISLFRLRYILIPNIVISTIVMAGNSLSTKHMTIMTSFTPFDNALVLIIGGYVLQGILLIFSVISLKKRKMIVNS